MTKAALYARVSTDDQAREEKVSLDTQKSDIEEHCRNNGYELVTPYYIDVQSGSDTMKNRPQFERMITDAESGIFDVIVAWKPDRLFRNMWPAARLKKTIDETGIDVEAVRQPLDKKMLGLWAWVAEMEIENFRDRSKMGKFGVARKGQIVTKEVPYGYKVGKDRYPEIKEEEALVVKRIFNEFLIEDKQVAQIIKSLNNDGAPLRNGTSKLGWSSAYIYRILRNPTYIGKGTYGQYIYTGKKTRLRPKEEQVIVPFPPIVDVELFNAAQEKKGKRIKSITRHYKATYLLRDIIYCKECGYKFITRDFWSHSRYKKSGERVVTHYDKPYRYYQCYGMFRLVGKTSCRKPGRYRADALEDLVWQKIVEVLQNPMVIADGIKDGKGPDQSILDTLASAKRSVSDLKWKRQKTIKLHIDGAITKEDLDVQLKLTTERMEFVNGEVERLSKEVSAQKKKQLDLSNLEALSVQFKDIIADLTPEEQAEIARLLIKQVWIDGEGNVEIEFAIPEPPTDKKAKITRKSVLAVCDGDMNP